MRSLRRLSRRIAAFVTRRQHEQRLKQEIEEHLALQIAEHMRDGLPAEEARRRALLKFGSIAALKESYRDEKSLPMIETLLQDTRHAFRRLRKSPAFTVTAILTLALGIGATTSIFTLVQAVLLRSLPVTKPEQLLRLGNEPHCCVWGGYSQGSEYSIVSYELYKHLRDHTRGFEELAAFQAGDESLGVRRESGENAAENYTGEFVSGNYFSMLGISAYAGRTVSGSDDRREAQPVCVMSYRLWRQKYALDPSVIGSVFYLNRKAFTVIGITPPGFFGDSLRNTPPDFFLPVTSEPLIRGDASMLDLPNRHWLDVIGRTRPGVTATSLQAQMRVALQHWLRGHLGDMDPNDRTRVPQQTLFLSPGGAGITSMRGAYEKWLKILMGVSGFVLLIVCTNVANLMLIRGQERRQQVSLSMALGARPLSLVRQALTESIILSLLGGIAGLAIAFAGARLILNLAFQSMTTSPISASPSLPVLAFAFGVSVLTGLAFGFAPAWITTRADPAEALRGANRATRRSGSLARKALVILQAALSLVLISMSGLLTVALRNLEHQNFGFEQDGRYVVSVNPQLAGYKPERLDGLYRRIRDSLAAIPGVASAASVLYAPQSGDSWNDMIFIAGKPAPGPQDGNVAWTNRMTPDYFATIGNPIVKGRAISERDTVGSQHVAVVNEAFARKFFKNEDPIGKHFGNAEFSSAGEYEVIGVAKDARYLTSNPTKPMEPFFFVPESQNVQFASKANTSGDVRSHFLQNVVILMKPGAKLSEKQVRAAFAQIDPNMPVLRMQTFSEQVADNFNQERLVAQLTSSFGILALVLACIGLYGVTAYTVGSRTNEIGIRMTLGANRSSVLTMILRGASTLFALGLLVGLPLTLIAGRLLSSQLFGVNPYDPTILTIAAIALAIPALVAALIPATRATSISPLQALRAE